MKAPGMVSQLNPRGFDSFSFEPERYQFKELVIQRLVERGFLDKKIPLNDIHQANSIEDITVDNSGQSNISTALYDMNANFFEDYVKFLKDVVRKHILPNNFYFQETPNFRCSVPGSPGYKWKPNYHTDIAIGHPPQSVNFWVPLTKCAGNNSLIFAGLAESQAIWDEFGYDFDSFHKELEEDTDLFSHCEKITDAFDGDYGEGLVFDARCMHLHQKNDTKSSRVSFDFRVIAATTLSNLEFVFSGTGRRKARFAPGDYYYKYSIDEM